MKLDKLTDRQIKMILERKLPDTIIAERLGVSKCAVSSCRTRLKKALAEGKPLVKETPAPLWV